MSRYILRRQSPAAPTPEELGTRLAARTRFMVLDQGPQHLFVSGDEGQEVLATETRDGWSITPERRYELPEKRVTAIHAPSNPPNRRQP